MTIPIFCINLERAIERKEKIKQNWIDNLGLDIQFWKAYDRRDIADNKYIYEYNKNNTIKFLNRELNYGEIACITSFCMLYEYLIEKNYQEAIIMEDDIIPTITSKVELFDCITTSKYEFPQCRMTLLHNPHPLQVKFREKDLFYNKKDTFSLCKIAPWGNQFFYIQIDAIKKIYSILIDMIMPADMAQNILSKSDIVCIKNKPICFHDWNSPNSDTYIGNDHRKTHRKFIP